MAIYSGFTHEKWWFSIVFCMFTRGYNSLVDFLSNKGALLVGTARWCQTFTKLAIAASYLGSGKSMVNPQNFFGYIHVISMSCYIHVISTWFPCDFHVISKWYPCDSLNSLLSHVNLATWSSSGHGLRVPWVPNRPGQRFDRFGVLWREHMDIWMSYIYIDR